MWQSIAQYALVLIVVAATVWTHRPVQESGPEHYDPALYRAERIFSKERQVGQPVDIRGASLWHHQWHEFITVAPSLISHSALQVPISLVYRADLHPQGLQGGPFPTLLTGCWA